MAITFDVPNFNPQVFSPTDASSSMMPRPALTPSNPDNDPTAISQRALVKQWLSNISRARKKYAPDFKRIRQDEEFAAGFQWKGQQSLTPEDQYVLNLTLRLVSQKVSNLYARNPECEAKPRKRMYYSIWDEKQESLQEAMIALANPATDPAAKLASAALLQDHFQGQQAKSHVQRVCDTLEIVYGYQTDNQSPSFKESMKQMVQRAVTCGVAYVDLRYSVDGQGTLEPSDTESTIVERAKRAKSIIAQMEDGKLTIDSPEFTTLKSLFESIKDSISSGDTTNINEKLIFNFPLATSIIPDPACTALKGFVGAHWVAKQTVLPLSQVNSYFELNIPDSTGLTHYNESGESTTDPLLSQESINVVQTNDHEAITYVCLYEVFDLDTKTTFTLCDGYKDYIQPPHPVDVETNHFWPWFPLVLNHIEVEPGQKASIFPSSDVTLIRSAQKEWNRSRNSLQMHRRANAPRWIMGRGTLTEDDKQAFTDAGENTITECEGIPPGTDATKLIAPIPQRPLEPLVYDTAPLLQDMNQAVGNQEGVQPASNKATATAASINEQSRIVTTSSNVDDVDDLLSNLAQAAGEIMIRHFSLDNVLRIAGPGAAWPDNDNLREDYLNKLFLTIVAASSGRPNKALDIANFQQLAPFLIQAGVNPQFMIRYMVKILDANFDPDDAFPKGVPAMPIAPPSIPQQSAPSPAGQRPASTIPRPQTQ